MIDTIDEAIRLVIEPPVLAMNVFRDFSF